ncbi:MAG: class I SAM-dependent methyltransferase [Firmicutes bacterium]|nr:class I SAM-dependent methyltransferase [Bacillota bacterium]
MSYSNLNIEEIMSNIKTAVKASKEKLEINESQNYFNQINNDGHEVIELKQEIRNNNQKWDIPSEWIITSHRKGIGRFIVFGKKVIRKLLRWYINPSWDQQRDFNASVTRSINILSEILQDTFNKNSILSLRLDENKALIEKHSAELVSLNTKCDKSDMKLETIRNQIEAIDYFSELTFLNDRLRRIERNIRQIQNVDLGKYKLSETQLTKETSSAPELDYLLFEHRFRGDREKIKERQNVYLKIFKDKTPILDIGCGRGEFIEMMIENGIEATGIDINDDMVSYCRDRNLPVLMAEGIAYLDSIENNSLGGIFIAQVVEHLKSDQIIYLITLAHKKLKPQGALVIETINPQVLYTFANQFYLDLTHEKPVHPHTLEFIFQQVGFKNNRFEFMIPAKDMQIPNLIISEDLSSNIREFNSAVDRLNQILYGEQDYAIIGIK